MYQTFYIDIDEEITSIVDRLRKARQKEVIVVVPKRALLIQSIVNLKLLKKEAENMGLRLGIVTQDNLGKLLVEKAGITLSQKVSDQEWENDEIRTGDEEQSAVRQPIPEFNPGEARAEKLKRERLETIGSNEYYSGNNLTDDVLKKNEQKKRIIKLAERVNDAGDGSSEKEAIVNKELIVGGGMDIVRKEKAAAPSLALNAVPAVSGLQSSQDARSNSRESERSVFDQDSSPRSFPDDEKIEKFFYSGYGSPAGGGGGERSVPSGSEASLSGGFKKYFLAFGLIFFLVVVLAVGYLFIPKATVIISAKDRSKAVDLEVLGDAKYTNIDFEKEIIPIQAVSVSMEASQSFPSTGNKSVSNKKARGMITIYNEYSSSPQPLVATTRFSTDDGKIFRLVKGITVPGSSSEGGSVKPGTIEAEVVADESGADYNIEPTKFSIPGFKGSGEDKYAKFYAKSEKQMQGGGAGSEELKSVSQADVDNAKKKIIEALEEKIYEEVRRKAPVGAVVLDDAIEKEEATYKLSNSVDEAVSNFEVSIQMNVKALVFSEDDLKELVNRNLAKLDGGKTKIDGSNVTLDYGKASSDFETETLKIKVHGSSKLDSGLDLEVIKKDILGKKEEDLAAYLSQYQDVSDVEVVYWPSFFNGKIPFYDKRVEVRLDN